MGVEKRLTGRQRDTHTQEKRTRREERETESERERKQRKEGGRQQRAERPSGWGAETDGGRNLRKRSRTQKHGGADTSLPEQRPPRGCGRGPLCTSRLGWGPHRGHDCNNPPTNNLLPSGSSPRPTEGGLPALSPTSVSSLPEASVSSSVRWACGLALRVTENEAPGTSPARGGPSRGGCLWPLDLCPLPSQGSWSSPTFKVVTRAENARTGCGG